MTLFRRKSKIEKALSIKDETEKIISIGQILWAKSAIDEDFESLNDLERNVLYIEMLESQVNNGGFDQYFFNSSGDYAHETLNALKQIKAPKMASMLEEAIKIFPSSPVPKDIEKRRRLMEEIPESINNKWINLENEFYTYPEHLAGLVIQYIQDNIDKFK